MNPYSPDQLAGKSSVAEIRARFDATVERFTNLKSGQAATVDAPLAMELITRAAAATTAPIRRVLDVGCGAGNNTIRLRQETASDFESHLLDLSEPMLDRARQLVAEAGVDKIHLYQIDFRDAELPESSFDVILAAAVLHHLRDDDDWKRAFTKIHRLLRPGGSIWITDLIWHETAAVQELMSQRYGEYLLELGGPEYRDVVFEYIEKEDSPRPVTYQVDLLRQVGFRQVELLHKNSCFAAFGAVK